MTDPLLTTGLPDAGVCLTTRETLDLSRPGDFSGGEAAAAALEEARRHLERCRPCQVAVRRNEQLNLRIGDVCRDVAIPGDLKTRLLASVAEAPASRPSSTETLPSGIPPTGSAAPVSRRRWLKKATAAAACVALSATGVWLATRRPLQKQTLDQWVQLSVGDDLSPDGLPLLSAYADGTLPEPPATMESRFLTDPPHQVADGRGAMYFFQFPARRGGATVQGRLLVVPARWVDAPPAATALLSRPAVYLGRGFCASIWGEGDFCYVCLVKGGGGENELHSLLRTRPVAT